MKKILSLLLVIAMMVTLAVTVSAEETTAYDLYVGGVQITDANKDDIVTAINDAANATVATGWATYDPETCTLTLDYFSYTGEGRVTQYYNAAISTDSINLNVQLYGTNTITCQSDDENVKCRAIFVWYGLDSSAGHLTIYGTDKEDDMLICTANDGISSVRSITVEDATVQTNGALISSRLGDVTITDSIVSADLEAGDITLENSVLETSETAYANNDFTITNSTVTGGGLSASDGAATLTVTGSRVNVTVISACGFIIEGNSNVTAQAILVDQALIVTDSSVHVTGCEIPELGLLGILLIRSEGVVAIDNSTVEVYGGNGAYLCTDDFQTFTPFAPLIGDFDIENGNYVENDNYTVIAGDDAESAVKVDSPTDATYASKYVKIGPPTSTITVEMADSAGNGWDHRARILALSVPSSSDVEGEEDILGVFTLESGKSGTQTLTIGKNQTVYFFWLFDNEGKYNYEDSFTIKRDGVTIYTHADDAEECPLTNWQRLVISEPIDARPTTITYEVAPTFTVTIPATVALGEDVTISADNVVVKKGQQVEVSLTDANGFAVTSAEGAELIYTVKNGDTAVAEGDIVLAVNPKDGKTGSTTLTFVAPTEYTYSGEYTGTVTFTIAVKDVPAKTISFTVTDYMGSTVLTADAGMTWAEWIDSDYNTYGSIWYSVDYDEYIWWGEPTAVRFNGEQVKYVDVVQEGEYIVDPR